MDFIFSLFLVLSLLCIELRGSLRISCVRLDLGKITILWQHGNQRAVRVLRHENKFFNPMITPFLFGRKWGAVCGHFKVRTCKAKALQLGESGHHMVPTPPVHETQDCAPNEDRTHDLQISHHGMRLTRYRLRYRGLLTLLEFG